MSSAGWIYDAGMRPLVSVIEPDWSKGACTRSADPDLWTSPGREEREAARNVCRSCPVQTACASGRSPCCRCPSVGFTAVCSAPSGSAPAGPCSASSASRQPGKPGARLPGWRAGATMAGAARSSGASLARRRPRLSATRPARPGCSGPAPAPTTWPIARRSSRSAAPAGRRPIACPDSLSRPAESSEVSVGNLASAEPAHGHVGLEKRIAEAKPVVLRAAFPDEDSPALVGSERFEMPGEGRDLILPALYGGQWGLDRSRREVTAVVSRRAGASKQDVLVQSLRPGAVGGGVIVLRHRFVHVGNDDLDREVHVLDIDFDALALYPRQAGLLREAMDVV